MSKLLQALLLAVAVGGCVAGNHDRSVADASSGGTGAGSPAGGTGGITTAPPETGGSPGTGGSPQHFPDDGDPCAPNLGRQPAPLVDGSAPECPRCSPYSQSHWDPSCSKPGLICEYQQHGGGSFGAFCRCGGLDGDAGARPDGAAPLTFSCGL
jgi:hypothetical protein